MVSIVQLSIHNYDDNLHEFIFNYNARQGLAIN